MPPTGRKQFRQDLLVASQQGVFPRLAKVGPGDDDASVNFTYAVPFSSSKIDFCASIPEISQYPKRHEYFTFVVSDDIPPAVLGVLDVIQESTGGLALHKFLRYVSDVLDFQILQIGSGMPPDPRLDTNDALSDDSYPWEEDMEYDFDETPAPRITGREGASKELRRDVRAAKEAGFKVGCLGDVTGYMILAVSCRIAKLGISPEAMHAWNVRPSEYLVLLIRYPQTYCSLQEMKGKGWFNGVPTVQMHVGVCESYKPTLCTAQRAFNVPQSSTSTKDTAPSTKGKEVLLKPLFIGGSLNELLNTRLLDMLAYRDAHGFSWTGAELHMHDLVAKAGMYKNTKDARYQAVDTWPTSTPELLSADHVRDTPDQTKRSLPLLAMQYTLRRFVKCTEFCLICYSTIEAGFEAIKPFVCSNELCLYQYMKLGMGPRVEWEIMAQPCVVDLLVSFTYARAISGKLEDFPVGLNLKVPKGTASKQIRGRFESSFGVISTANSADVSVGNWIVIHAASDCGKTDFHSTHLWHCRVVGVESDRRSIYVADPIHTGGPSGHPPPEMPTDVVIMKYDHDFDSLHPVNKREAITMLLDTLPAVTDMRSFINRSELESSEMPLSAWHDRVSPDAYFVLKWIVASNRSCIMYDEDPEHQVSGVPGYLQFRLAQGAPDKEERFVSAVESVSQRTNTKYPTLFAWHGSMLDNWHSILREGLHYKKVANGRSWGDGVYLARDFLTSNGFSSRRNGGQAGWRGSQLNVTAAISLNEVVNAPAEFVCSAGCYVVNKLDWIQTRYLFVQCRTWWPGTGTDTGTGTGTAAKKTASVKPSRVLEQDPSCPVLGPYGSVLVIPLSVLSTRRKQEVSAPTSCTTTRSKIKSVCKDLRHKAYDMLGLPEDCDSVATLSEDQALLEPDSEDDEETKKQKRLAASLKMTDFRPGQLTESSLKLLAPPKYATSKATKALQAHLKATLKSQDEEPLHELGWSIDPTLINNVYQWIVEFHSFDATLPLAQDLKAAGLKSIVMELRFPPQFPHSPPFVRVLRPRFLMFNAGGGGHVTAGGAMCMELLTSSGWSPALSMESVLLQVRLAMTSQSPPARLDNSSYRNLEYGVGEAIQAYVRACRAHGWAVAEDIKQVGW